MKPNYALMREQFERDGFAITDTPQIPADLITRSIERMNALAGGIYDRPGRPYRRWNVGHATRIQKIDNAHLADQTIFELVSHPAIAQLAAEITGAKMIQVWSTQLLYKPPQSGQDGCVGWHRDMQYWKCWRGTLLTITVALSPLSLTNGAVSFVRGSHRWQELDEHGNAYRQDLSAHRDVVEKMFGQPWEEQPLEAQAGALSVHHAQTIHGSGPNTEHDPRRSIAINLRTEDTEPIAGEPDFGMWDCLTRPAEFPVIYNRLPS